jgi:hypothetical protein
MKKRQFFDRIILKIGLDYLKTYAILSYKGDPNLFGFPFFIFGGRGGERTIKLLTTAFITPKGVIPEKAGIQRRIGFRVKPGMTKYMRPMSSCIKSFKKLDERRPDL